MPLYEYRCQACHHSFEKIQSFSAPPESQCPKCGGQLIRPISAPALQFKGAGWYINDYSSKGKASASAEGAASEAPASDIATGEKTKDERAASDAGKAESKPAESTAKTSAPAPAASASTTPAAPSSGPTPAAV